MITKFSQLFVPTLKEAPAEAVAASHRLLIRAGFIRQIGAGLYARLPLAQRCLAKVEAIVRDEMRRVNAQEFQFSGLLPAEIWRQSGRWDEMGEEMFRLKDRRGGEYCLGMTHEELFAATARDELRSYRQLPQVWYQIQTKFRDEPRPKGGFLRMREFIMKDAYSFDVDAAGLDRSYQAQKLAYERVFRRTGLEFVPVEAYSGRWAGGSRRSSWRGPRPVRTWWWCALAVATRRTRRSRARSPGPRRSILRSAVGQGLSGSLPPAS